MAKCDFASNVPIYLQIMNDIKLKVVSGEWEAGQRLQSVRELALEFSVNPNTMQRAYLSWKERLAIHRKNFRQICITRTNQRFLKLEMRWQRNIQIAYF